MRNIDKLFELNDEEIQRGTVGFGTQGFNDVYFDGATVEFYSPETGLDEIGADKRRVWDQCLTESTKAKRLKFCKTIFGIYEEGI